MPISARKNIRIGISKIRPMPSTMLRKSCVYSPIVIIGWNWRAEVDQKFQRSRVDDPVAEVSARR